MPRAFTEEEKKIIRKDLQAIGSRLFGQYGLRKTSVDEITDAAGISKGAFYKFYTSKEDLLYDILSGLEIEIQQRIMLKLSDPDKDSKEILKEVLLEQFRLSEDIPLIRFLLDKKEYEAFFRKLSADQKQVLLDRDMDFAGQLLSRWEAEGRLKVKSIPLATSLFRSVFFLSLHKEEIGAESFDQVLSHLVGAIVDSVII